MRKRFPIIATITTMLVTTGAGTARAGAANIIIHNRANRTVDCAKTYFDRRSSDWIIQTGFQVQSGGDVAIGPGAYVYCEEGGNPAYAWSGSLADPQFCVASHARGSHATYGASVAANCHQRGGDLRRFVAVPGSYASYDWTLNP